VVDVAGRADDHSPHYLASFIRCRSVSRARCG
jgi:hypothetical protein